VVLLLRFYFQKGLQMPGHAVEELEDVRIADGAVFADAGSFLLEMLCA
jgi:hypothetical protein